MYALFLIFSSQRSPRSYEICPHPPELGTSSQCSQAFSAAENHPPSTASFWPGTRTQTIACYLKWLFHGSRWPHYIIRGHGHKREKYFVLPSSSPVGFIQFHLDSRTEFSDQISIKQYIFGCIFHVKVHSVQDEKTPSFKIYNSLLPWWKISSLFRRELSEEILLAVAAGLTSWAIACLNALTGCTSHNFLSGDIQKIPYRLIYRFSWNPQTTISTSAKIL